MESYFEECIRMKIVLSKMLEEFYVYYLDTKRAFEIGLEFDENDMRNGKVSCIFHKYSPEAIFVFEELGIDKPIVTYNNFLKKSLDVLEEKNEETDYYKKYLELLLHLIYMIEKHYEMYIKKEEALKLKIEYSDQDVVRGYVRTYNHHDEDTGKSAWTLLNFENNYVTRNELFKLKESLSEELLYRTYEKNDIKVK